MVKASKWMQRTWVKDNLKGCLRRQQSYRPLPCAHILEKFVESVWRLNADSQSDAVFSSSRWWNTHRCRDEQDFVCKVCGGQFCSRARDALAFWRTWERRFCTGAATGARRAGTFLTGLIIPWHALITRSSWCKESSFSFLACFRPHFCTQAEQGISLWDHRNSFGVGLTITRGLSYVLKSANAAIDRRTYLFVPTQGMSSVRIELGFLNRRLGRVNLSPSPSHSLGTTWPGASRAKTLSRLRMTVWSAKLNQRRLKSESFCIMPKIDRKKILERSIKGGTSRLCKLVSFKHWSFCYWYELLKQHAALKDVCSWADSSQFVLFTILRDIRTTITAKSWSIALKGTWKALPATLMCSEEGNERRSNGIWCWKTEIPALHKSDFVGCPAIQHSGWTLSWDTQSGAMSALQRSMGSTVSRVRGDLREMLRLTWKATWKKIVVRAATTFQ